MKIDLTPLHLPAGVDGAALCAYAAWIMKKVAALDPARHWTELSLVLTDDRIRDLNRQWFGRDTVTDVISFAYPALPPDTGDTGEVILNLALALGEGRKRESPDQELALYLAHGCHHLMGADDATPEDKAAMLSLETAWVRDAVSQNLCGPFFTS